MSSTAPIDEKKNDNVEATPINIKGFVFNYIYSLIFTISLGIFVLGTTGLYTSKVAQANFLPDNSELAPFTNIDRVVEDIPIDINVMRHYFWSDPKETLSQKAIFDNRSFLQSYKNSLVCTLNTRGQPNASMFANGTLYWSTVYNNMTAYNNWFMNTIFFYLSYLPESIIMIVYSIFAVFLWALLYFFNICLSIIFHITAIPQLVRHANSRNRNEWQAQADISFFTWKTLFLFLWLIPIILTFMILPIISTFNGIIAPLCATYHYNGSTDKQNIFNFIIDTFVYKKLLFMILATLSLISNGINYLGSSSIISIIVAIIILYFLGFYSNSLPKEGENGFVIGLRKPFTQLKSDVVYTTNSEGRRVSKKVTICTPTNVINDTLTNDTIPSPINTVTDDMRVRGGTSTVNIAPYTNSNMLEPTAPSNVNTFGPNTGRQMGITSIEPLPPSPTTMGAQENYTPVNDMDVYDWTSQPNQRGAVNQRGGENVKKPRVKKYNIKIM